jgi:hypothetical protein
MRETVLHVDSVLPRAAAVSINVRNTNAPG